ncbi:MAG: 50S ribosomal protein L9 [Paludibacteraceae bacterium]|nr:50S ribosomal protein L9 [Paludibacteraceae bacterium]
MEVILLEDIQNLGYKNDIVKVRDGYGRNYLLPQKKAVIANESAKKRLAEELRQKAHKLAKIKADAEELAAKLANVRVKLTVKVGANGQLFGSVGNIQVAEALAAQGFDIDRKIIEIKAVKELGEHNATIKLHKEVKVELPVEVVAEEAE